MLVVSIETWPSQARMVLISTPARRRWVAVVCLGECGLTRFVAQCLQFCRYSLHIAFHHCVNAKAHDWPTTGLEKEVLMALPSSNAVSAFAVCGHKGQRGSLLPFPWICTELRSRVGVWTNSKFPIVSCAARRWRTFSSMSGCKHHAHLCER